MDKFDGFGGPEVFFEFLLGVPFWLKIVGGIFLVGVMAIFAYAIIKGLLVWSANNKKQIYMRYAVIVSKRTVVLDRPSGTSPVQHFITFELEDGNRLEFQMTAREYSFLMEKDEGEVTYQGTSFKNFNRRIKGEYKLYG